MGIIKEVDGRVFVDGGVDCPTCEGRGKIYECGPYAYSRTKIAHNQELINCPTCHGPGVEPVHDWPDSFKADWIWGQSAIWCPHHDNEHAPREGPVKIDVYLKGDQCDADPSIEVEGADFSAALTAAVIAVARQQTQEVAE